METTLNQVTALCKKLSGHEACHQLMSQLCRDMSFGKMEAFADAFASRDDIMLELPWGKYQSRDSIRHCLLHQAAFIKAAQKAEIVTG